MGVGGTGSGVLRCKPRLSHNWVASTPLYRPLARCFPTTRYQDVKQSGGEADTWRRQGFISLTKEDRDYLRWIIR